MSTVVQTGRAQKVTNKELYTEMQPKGTLLQEVIERTSKMFSCEFLILTIIINNVNFIFILFFGGPTSRRKVGGQKLLHLLRFSTTSRFNGEYLLKET